MPDPVAVFGAITGAGGLVLGIINARHNFGADTRARQKELQSELRSILQGAAKEFERLKISLHSGHNLPKADPDLRAAAGKLTALEDRLTRPRQIDVTSAGMRISAAVHAWSEVVFEQDFAEASGKAVDPRKWNARADNLRKELEAAESAIKMLLDELNAIDKGL